MQRCNKERRDASAGLTRVVDERWSWHRKCCEIGYKENDSLRYCCEEKFDFSICSNRFGEWTLKTTVTFIAILFCFLWTRIHWSGSNL